MYLLTSCFCIPVPCDEKDIILGVLVLEFLVGVHRTIQLQLPLHWWLGTDLDYCDTEQFALEANWQHSVILQVAHNYHISNSYVDYEGYSISSKGFLPIEVDIMVTWIKLTHSCPF